TFHCTVRIDKPRMAGIFHLAEAKNAGKVLPVQTATLYVNPATKMWIIRLAKNTYESFTCWRIVTAEGMDESGGSNMAGGSRASETPEFKLC
ncbi:hypothetical protein Tco_1481009, partial [Tanacetum coccineum]